MRTLSASAAIFTLIGAILPFQDAFAQAPEQQQMWDAQRAQAQAAEKARADRLAQERAARKAEPMAWVRTLDPMSAGGWVFRTVAGDGSWAIFVTDHQLRRSGQIVTVWLRHEYAEPQTEPGGSYFLSNVEQVEFDCAKDRGRAALAIYYSENNLKGSEQSVAADPKVPPWSPIVPGTQNESNAAWACSAVKAHAAH